jgi:hypothetical protein
MATWLKILPMFVIEWLAKKYCACVVINNMVFVEAFDKVLIYIGEVECNESTR